MIITDDSNNPLYKDVQKIDIPFPQKKYDKLLEICNLDKNSKLGPHQITQIFVNAVYHFLQGHLSQDDLSSIASSLWFEYKNKSDELGSTLLAADEMAFYSRRIYHENGKHGGFESWMIKVMEFYNKNRKAVVKDK